jgi:hypothetical protein
MNDIARILRDVTERGDELRQERGAAEEARRKLFETEEVAPRTPAMPRVVWLAAAAALLAFVAVFVFRREETLSFAVAGRTGTTMTWIDVTEGVTPVRFSDGTQVLLQPGARARVDVATARGAEVSIEAGRAVVSVVPKPDAHWVFHAGDYDVRVTGTVFDLAWSRDDKSLFVQMHEGSVVITGPDLAEPRVLQAGESLSLGQRAKETTASAPAEAPKHEPASPAHPVAESPEPAAAAGGGSPAPAPRTPAATWRDLASQGDNKGACALLEPSFATEVGAADAAGLLEIARVCRLGGSAERANTAYLALRSKYPGTPEAAQAAFALGGLRFASDPSAAKTWFSTFLAEAPNHALASAARGRLLELAVAAKSADAKQVAADYLANHPDGAHAALARSTLARKDE